MIQRIKNSLLWFDIICYDFISFDQDIAKHLHGDLLDIGCGSKHEFFKNKVKKYIGLDYPPTLNTNNMYNFSDVDVFGDAHKLPFKDNTFDCAVSLSVFEHLKEPWVAAREAYRVLKKGGIFAITVPLMNRIHDAPYDYYRFTIYGIRYILENAGFKIIKTQDGGGMWKTIGARLAGYLYSDVMGLGYGKNDLEEKPRKYLFPFFAPMIIFIVIMARFLDKVHCVKKDTLHYYILCQK